jgi:hypothetical protein
MREFFVLNESMIESWSAFTPELQAEVARGIEALTTLESALMGRACFEPDVSAAVSPICWRERVLEVWDDPTLAASSLLGLYELALAFPNDLYLPTRDNLRRLIETLELVPFDEEPLIHIAADATP